VIKIFEENITAGGNLRKKPDRKLIQKTGLLLLKTGCCLGILLFLFTIAQVLLLRYTNPVPKIHRVWARIYHRFNETTYLPPKLQWKNLNEISPNLKKAVLASEDQRFLAHDGFDFIEIRHALIEIFSKGRIRGASTISMQTARSVFLWKDRSLFRKILEAYYTFLMEFFLDKKRIMELYLNTVDWGPGVTGAQAASQRYFNIHASDLNPSQAALLAAILPSPHKWSVTNPSPYVQNRQRAILKHMNRMPRI
jgi:monofunctional biosynthetic peptidoglycan transglycosylase